MLDHWVEIFILSSELEFYLILLFRVLVLFTLDHFLEANSLASAGPHCLYF